VEKSVVQSASRSPFAKAFSKRNEIKIKVEETGGNIPSTKKFKNN
jgi:hypothetical protein